MGSAKVKKIDHKQKKFLKKQTDSKKPELGSLNKSSMHSFDRQQSKDLLVNKSTVDLSKSLNRDFLSGEQNKMDETQNFTEMKLSNPKNGQFFTSQYDGEFPKPFEIREEIPGQSSTVSEAQVNKRDMQDFEAINVQHQSMPLSTVGDEDKQISAGLKQMNQTMPHSVIERTNDIQ